jgi:predicted aspartyl protease
MRKTANPHVFLLALAVAVTCGSLLAAAARADCQLAKILDLPVNSDDPQARIPAQINGQELRLLVDSGAVESMVSTATAARLKLQTYYPANSGVRRRGSADVNHIEIARVPEMKVAGLTIKDGEMSLIGGSAVGDGVLGQNVLRHFTVEYDFGHGMMRLFTANGCESAKFAYWLAPEDRYSSMRIGIVEDSNPYTAGEAYVNGARVRVVFDSGLTRSIITRDAAARAGVKVKTKERVDAGVAEAPGLEHLKTYVGEFATFKIGDNEQLRNVKIPIADVKLRYADMLLGADFFMAHHIIVGNKEERLMMSYNGGPPFNVVSSTP